MQPIGNQNNNQTPPNPEANALNSNQIIGLPTALHAVQDGFLQIQNNLLNQYEEMNQRVLQLTQTNKNLKVLASFTSGLAIALLILHFANRASKKQ